MSSNLVSIETNRDCRKVVEDALEWSGECDAVMIVAIDKHGNQILRTSTMSGMEKAFLVAFINAWMTKWYRLEDQT